MKVLPRDFVETREGLVFAVVDAVLEDDKVLAFLRYAPDSGVKRKVSTDEANSLLRHEYPRYLHRSARLDASLHAVPLADIAQHHRPRERLAAITQRGPQDAIEEDLLRLLELLATLGVPVERLGVTGSLLIGRQNPTSDIDLVAYGREAFFAARAMVSQLIKADKLEEPGEADWRVAFERRGCALGYDEFVRHERRKGNKGMIAGRKFDLALIQEVCAETDLGVWRKCGGALIRAQVVDSSNVFDQPARYRIDHPELSEILSFTHTYAGQAEAGEWVEAAGAIETHDDGRKRLIIGSSREAPGEYIRVLWERLQGPVA